MDVHHPGDMALGHGRVGVMDIEADLLARSDPVLEFLHFPRRVLTGLGLAVRFVLLAGIPILVERDTELPPPNTAIGIRAVGRPMDHR